MVKILIEKVEVIFRLDIHKGNYIPSFLRDKDI